MNKKLMLGAFLAFNILTVQTTKPILSEAISLVLVYHYVIAPLFKAHVPAAPQCCCEDKIKTIEQILIAYGFTLIDLKNLLTTLGNQANNQQEQIDNQQEQINLLSDLESELEDAVIDTMEEVQQVEAEANAIIYYLS